MSADPDRASKKARATFPPSPMKRGVIIVLSIVLSGTLALYALRGARASTPLLPSGLRSASFTTNAIQAENSLPGDSHWLMTDESTAGEIQAYTGQDSVALGGSVDVYISTNPHPSTVTIDVYRLGYYGGLGARHINTYDNVPTTAQGFWLDPSPYPTNCPTCLTNIKDSLGQQTDVTVARWSKTTSIPFTKDSSGRPLISGLYLLKLTDNTSHTQWSLPVVVRNDSGPYANLVVEIPFNTYQAYNRWGGTSLYRDYRSSTRTNAYWASYDRPITTGAGNGDLLAWTFQMTYFLEQSGYSVDYATNNSISAGVTNLLNYKGYVSAGHNEYMTLSERTAIQNAIAHNVGVAFFGANDMYVQVRMTSSGSQSNRTIIGYKTYYQNDPYFRYASLHPQLSTYWREYYVNNSEDKVTGVMFGDLTTQNNQNFVAKNTSHWAYKGTGLKDGQTIPGILGIEVDTAYNDGGITSSTTVLGQSPFVGNNNPHAVQYTVINEPAGKNIVFTAGTEFWPDALVNNAAFAPHYPHANPIPYSAALAQMTKNILNRMIYGSQAVTTSPPLQGNSGVVYTTQSASTIPTEGLASEETGNVDTPPSTSGAGSGGSPNTSNAMSQLLPSGVHGSPLQGALGRLLLLLLRVFLRF